LREINMSQEFLGEQIGLTFQQIQKYEKGTNRIGASRIQQIGKILEVPASFFFDGAPGGWEGEPVRLRPRYSSCSVRVSARFLLTRSCASPTPRFDAASCASSKKRPR
jgi:transcriptional regulator with XRE-family HTH domain